MIYFFVILFVIVVCIFWNQFALLLFFLFAMPFDNFSDSKIPFSYDYSNKESWYLLDSRKPIKDKTPETDFDKKRTVVFFIHPTTFFNRDNWNQPKEDERSARIIRERIIPNQASIFFSCCDVYLPKYRQANIYSFIASSKNSKKAFDVAFKDIQDSFKYFNKYLRKGRPFVIASHSQGTMHAQRLVLEISRDHKVIKDFIVGYLVGYEVFNDSNYPLVVCQDASEYGCIVGWNTVPKDGFKIFKQKDLVCVNPLSWEENEVFMPNLYNYGSMGFSGWFEQIILGAPIIFPIEKYLVGAQCKNGSLEVEPINSDNYPVRLFSLHAYDYGLFFKNIETNVDMRIKQYFKETD